MLVVWTKRQGRKYNDKEYMLKHLPDSKSCYFLFSFNTLWFFFMLWWMHGSGGSSTIWMRNRIMKQEHRRHTYCKKILLWRNRYKKNQICRSKSNGNLPITDLVEIYEENFPALLSLVRYWDCCASLLEQIILHLLGTPHTSAWSESFIYNRTVKV